MHQSNVGDVMNECQTWWEENCLYLEPGVREAFLQAYAAVGYQGVLLDSKGRGEETRAEIRRNRKLIAAFDQTPLKAIELPPLSTEVQNPLQRMAAAEAEVGWFPAGGPTDPGACYSMMWRPPGPASQSAR